MTLVFAHRGASLTHAENTVAAFVAASDLGADGVELDVRRTADDALVVHHDAHLPDGRAIRETRAADLPVAIPTLNAALDACSAMMVNIEVKNDPSEPDFDAGEWVATALTAQLARRGGGARWLVSSFRRETVGRVRALLPSVRTALLVFEADARAVQACAAGGHLAVHPWVDALREDQVRAAHAAGLLVNAWTCDAPERLAELVAWGVDGICTNDPALALAVRRSAAC